MILKTPVPVGKIGCRLPEILVVANRDMHGIQPTFSHLAENPARPVAVLKTVDSRVC